MIYATANVADDSAPADSGAFVDLRLRPQQNRVSHCSII